MSKVLKGIGKVAAPVLGIAGAVTGNPALGAIGQVAGLASSAFGSSPKNIPQLSRGFGGAVPSATQGILGRGLATPGYTLMPSGGQTVLSRTSKPSIPLTSLSGFSDRLAPIIAGFDALGPQMAATRDRFGQLAGGLEDDMAQRQALIASLGGDREALLQLAESLGGDRDRLNALAAELGVPRRQLQQLSEELRKINEEANAPGGLRSLIYGFQNLDAGLSNLEGEVKPGYGRLTESAVKTIRDRQTAAVGNLRESLAKRRLQGASFADQEISKVNLSFAQEEEAARAEAILNEIQASQGIIGQRQQVQQQIADFTMSLFDFNRDTVLAQAGLAGAEADIIGQQGALTQAAAGVTGQQGALRQAASNLVDQQGKLIEDNVNTVYRQAQILGQQIGLDELASQNLARQIVGVKTQADIQNLALQRQFEQMELDTKEFAYLSNYMNGLQNLIAESAAFDIKNQIAAAEAQGSVQRDLFGTLSDTKSLGRISRGFGDIARTFGFNGPIAGTGFESFTPSLASGSGPAFGVV